MTQQETVADVVKEMRTAFDLAASGAGTGNVYAGYVARWADRLAALSASRASVGEVEERTKIVQAIARGWCSPKNAHKVMDPDLAEAITVEILQALPTPPPQPKETEVVAIAFDIQNNLYSDAMDAAFGNWHGYLHGARRNAERAGEDAGSEAFARRALAYGIETFLRESGPLYPTPPASQAVGDKDGERYRWLRSRDETSHRVVVRELRDQIAWAVTGSELDQAIDAAMLKGERGECMRYDTAVDVICAGCGIAIKMTSVTTPSGTYHPSCVPEDKQLTEADVRRIVREELAKQGAAPMNNTLAALDRAIELARDQLEAWSGGEQHRSDIRDLQALRDALAGGARVVPGDYTPVRTETLLWLLGERGYFECPPDRYFRGKPTPYFWRNDLREAMLPNGAPAPDEDGR